jgi:hypothetical protein
MILVLLVHQGHLPLGMPSSNLGVVLQTLHSPPPVEMGKSSSSMIIMSFDILWLHKPCRGNAIAKSQQTIPLPSMSNVTLTPVYAAR